MYVCVRACLYECARMCKYACMCAFMHVSVWVGMPACVVCARVFVCECVCMVSVCVSTCVSL